jgi:hypothetical protein
LAVNLDEFFRDRRGGSRCDFRENKMSNLEFGLTLTVFGMGGTLVILYLLSLVIDVLNKCLPAEEEAKK